MKLIRKTILFPDQILDIVLEDMILYQSHNAELQTVIKISDRVLNRIYEQYNVDINFLNLNSVLEQLVEDRHIKYDNDTAVAEERLYYVTFRGAWFIKNSGYKGLIEDKHNDRLRLEQIETNQRRNANGMTFLTIALTVSGLVGTIYSFLEIRTHHSGFYQMAYPYFLPVGVGIGIIIALLLFIKIQISRNLWMKRKKAYKRYIG